MSPKIIVKKILLQLSHFYVIQRFPYNPVSIEQTLCCAHINNKYSPYKSLLSTVSYEGSISVERRPSG